MIGVFYAGTWLRQSKQQRTAGPLLRIRPELLAGGDLPGSALLTNIVLDDLRQKYVPARRVAFLVNSVRDTSVFVLATGVQVHTPAGWHSIYEENRGEIWRLKSGIPREVCVERPEGEAWRAYVRYGTEMKGASLLSVQLREAWNDRSFSNWTGKAWGGGRWSGACETFSEEFTE